MFACARGNDVVVSILLEHGADVRDTDWVGRSGPVWYVTHKGGGGGGGGSRQNIIIAHAHPTIGPTPPHSLALSPSRPLALSPSLPLHRTLAVVAAVVIGTL